MTKQQQNNLIEEIKTMGTRQQEALKRSISVSDANSFVKDRLMNVIDEREGRLVRIDEAAVVTSELKMGEI